jgi:hypothetical protein
MDLKRAWLLPAAIALIGVLSLASGSQEKKAADKYAAYCGEYQFDLTSYGAGLITAKVYVENDALYMWADRSEPPDVLNPVENIDSKFSLDDPDEGHWDIEFLKDDQGKFTKCRLVNAGLGIDVVGGKVED